MAIERRYTPTELEPILRRHYKTIVAYLRAGALHGTQTSGKRGQWLVVESCAEAFLERRPCPHRAKVASLDEKRRTKQAG